MVLIVAPGGEGLFVASGGASTKGLAMYSLPSGVDCQHQKDLQVRDQEETVVFKSSV
jgi:hypothetical protein